MKSQVITENYQEAKADAIAVAIFFICPQIVFMLDSQNLCFNASSTLCEQQCLDF